MRKILAILTAILTAYTLTVPLSFAHTRSNTPCSESICQIDITGTSSPFYNNPDLRVGPGAKIIVLNHHSLQHSLTSGTAPTPDDKFDTGILDPSQQATITVPTSAGTYTYFCRIHSFMRAKLTVDPAIPEFPLTYAVFGSLATLMLISIFVTRSKLSK